MNAGFVTAIKISRLESIRSETIALVPADFESSGLPAVRVVKDLEGHVIFFYVNRLDYIKHLKLKHQIVKKRENIKCLK